MVSHCPSPLVQSMLLNSLLQCAVLGMKLHHKDANRGTLNFLENIVSYSLKLRTSSSLDANEQTNIAALERAIVTEGQPLVINLALALVGDLPAYRLDSGSGFHCRGTVLSQPALSGTFDAVDPATVNGSARGCQECIAGDAA